MYSINNHEAIIGIYYGLPESGDQDAIDTLVGIEIKPPLNLSERQLVKDWLTKHQPHYILYFEHMSHADDASRFGTGIDTSRSAELISRIRTLGYHIRSAIKSAGREIALTEEVYNLDR